MDSMSDVRTLSIIATREEIKLETVCVFPPIPIRLFDWQANEEGGIDCGDFDGETGRPIYSGIAGHGATEAQAIEDFLERRAA